LYVLEYLNQSGDDGSPHQYGRSNLDLQFIPRHSSTPLDVLSHVHMRERVVFDNIEAQVSCDLGHFLRRYVLNYNICRRPPFVLAHLCPAHIGVIAWASTPAIDHHRLAEVVSKLLQLLYQLSVDPHLPVAPGVVHIQATVPALAAEFAAVEVASKLHPLTPRCRIPSRWF